MPECEMPDCSLPAKYEDRFCTKEHDKLFYSSPCKNPNCISGNVGILYIAKYNGCCSLECRDTLEYETEIEQLTGLVETLRREAEMHAQEARTQRSTVHAAYQICTGNTGEPGDWNGAEPIRKLKKQHDEMFAELEVHVEECTQCEGTGIHIYGKNKTQSCTMCGVARDLIAKAKG